MRIGDADIFTFYLGTKVIHSLHSVRQTGVEFKAQTPVPSANIRKATMGDLVRLYEKALEGWD